MQDFLKELCEAVRTDADYKNPDTEVWSNEDNEALYTHVQELASDVWKTEGDDYALVGNALTDLWHYFKKCATYVDEVPQGVFNITRKKSPTSLSNVIKLRT